MRRKIFVVLSILAVLFCLSSLALNRETNGSAPLNAGPEDAAENPKPYVPITPKRVPRKPVLEKYTEYPPRTAKGEEMWQWWRAMSKSDVMFEWKMPIEFYGRVVDQAGTPIEGAIVEVQLNRVGGVSEWSLVSGADGGFSLTGLTGKSLGISVTARRCLSTRGWTQGFEYAEFFSTKFHVPDKNNPVIFRLQKLIRPEPMHNFSVRVPLSPNGPSRSVDLSNGKVGEVGDLSFLGTIKWSKSGPIEQMDLIVKGARGTLVVGSDDEFLFTPPAGGFVNELRLCLLWKNNLQGGMYFVTGEQKFGAVKLEGRNSGEGVVVDLEIFLNPSGSRNLEYDQNMQIPSRPE